MSKSRAELGGKGYALQQLQDAGFNVPRFIVLPASFFSEIKRLDNGASLKIIEACKSSITDWKEFFRGRKVAVRSSAIAEDSDAHSYAGQLKTLLNVAPEQIGAAVVEVWMSSNDALVYEAAHQLHGESGMAVILQEMVNATAAGVAFSAHPVNGTAETIINAVSGLGDKLVDGSITADAYIVLHGSIVMRQPAETTSVLSDSQVLQVAELTNNAHNFFGGPQDVEFAFHDDELFMLQSRPITTLPKTATIWDNSNIVESYPGFTQPLTFSFIQKMYEAVYRQFSALLGVSRTKIDAHKDAFANMLGLLNGRVYYNLNSWYSALALLPGYSINAAFMERMMGVNEKPDVTISVVRTTKISAWWEVATAVTGILRNLVSARRQAKCFAHTFNRVYASFAGKDFEAASLQQLWQDYQLFERLMLREWKAPLVNDFFAMIYFGLLQKLCAGIAPEDANLHNRLLAGSDNVLTTQPMKELPKIAAAIAASPALLKIATSGSKEELFAALQAPEHAAVWKLFTAYISVWGERSVAELKLETITYQQEPLLLIGLLQSYLAQRTTATIDRSKTGFNRQQAEAAVRSRLKRSWGKQLLFNHVLRQARYFVTQRENLRYYRTRGFGMVRRMMIALGKRLSECNSIDSPRDVFWLKLEEIEALAGELKPMHKTVAQRKTVYKNYEPAVVPERLVSYGTPKGVISLHPTGTTGTDTAALKGMPCSAGIVRATVRLVTYADEPKSLDGAILATYATDPGFVVLFASAGGILTERGSLLSHAAIVSREMGIPCIVGIEGLMDRLNDGDLIEMDGSTGKVTIIE